MMAYSGGRTKGPQLAALWPAAYARGRAVIATPHPVEKKTAAPGKSTRVIIFAVQRTPPRARFGLADAVLSGELGIQQFLTARRG